MKRFLFLLMAFTLLLTGCGTPKEVEVPLADNTSDVTHETAIEAPTSDFVEIKERLFIAQTNDIYLNAQNYLGKTLKYEGMFKIQDITPEERCYYVIRYGPGCCGTDGDAGFEVIWDNGWPEADDLCEAVGVLESYEIDGFAYLRVRLTSLTVLSERGQEYVST